MNQNWGWSIPDWLLARTDLEGNEKLMCMILGRLGALEKPVHPRQAYLGEKLGITEDATGKLLKRMEKKGLVKFEGRKWKIQQYSLILPNGGSSPDQMADDSSCQMADHKRREQSRRKHIDNNNLATPSASRVETGVKEVMEAFYESVNPNLNFGNKTQRAAAEFLAKKIGLEKLIPVIKSLAVSNLEQYAPRIHTPLALREKWSALVDYWKRKEANQPRVIKL